MKTYNNKLTLHVSSTDKVCAAGEEYGRQCQLDKKIPVFSCEGGCVKGEIARQAANIVAKDSDYARACHGELFTVPHADLAKWVREAKQVVVIDGCSLFCHGRIAENIIGKDQLVIFDALSIHRKYANLMNVDDVPDEERKQTAKAVADKILCNLKDGISCYPDEAPSCQCGSAAESNNSCLSSQSCRTEDKNLSINNARKFVEKLRDNNTFRNDVLSTTDSERLSLFLHKENLVFNQRELVEAMTECMAQLELKKCC